MFYQCLFIIFKSNFLFIIFKSNFSFKWQNAQHPVIKKNPCEKFPQPTPHHQSVTIPAPNHYHMMNATK